MKTAQEILNFYGVKCGKKYKIGSMYKGMKVDKPYRPIELGLEE